MRLPRLAIIVRRGTFALLILGRPYILGISSGIDKMFEKRRDWVLPLPSLNHFLSSLEFRRGVVLWLFISIGVTEQC